MITSTSNLQVKQLIQLQKKAKERNTQDVFVVEGLKMALEVPDSQLVQTYVSERFYEKNPAFFDESRPVTVLSDRVFESVSDTRTPQGVLCVVRQYHYEIEDLLGNIPCEAWDAHTPQSKIGGIIRRGANAREPLIIALENLQDPGNLGTIVRTAEGAGITGVLLSRDCVDLYNPKVIRSTMGAIYRMPFSYADDFRQALRTLKCKGVRLFAAHLEGSIPYDEETYCGPSGFLIGNESQGLTGGTAAIADARIRIPMCGQVESLNAAVAASVLMYEANRQRRNAGGKKFRKEGIVS
ncbi:MAG: RNA methyltransferase [Clostridiales bacterium]|nr:RNA methyltransferase [Clostridiales bacterium]